MERASCGSSPYEFAFGMEQEYALALLSGDGAYGDCDKARLFRTVLTEVKRMGIPYLDVSEHAIFLPYGLLYMESTGIKLETAVAPSNDPFDAAANDEKFMSIVAEALRRCRRLIPRANALRNTRDYYSPAETWGAHESYYVRRPFAELEQALLPFLVTRQVWSGAGTLEHGEYWLSARAPYMVHATGGGTTCDRAIFSTARNEPLMRRGAYAGRLHLIMGDALMSQYGNIMKLGVTALVLRCAEQYPGIGDAVRFEDPVHSIRALSYVNTSGWSKQLVFPRLLEVQRHYLHAVENMLERDDHFPAWCTVITRWWQEMLDNLSEDPMIMADRLDAYIKLKYLSMYLEHCGKKWRDLRYYAYSGETSDILREVMLEDVFYHTLLDSTFTMLEEDGALNHRVLDRRQTTPGAEREPYIPDEGLPRERQRSQFIKAHSREQGYIVTWDKIIDEPGRRIWSLEDPFSSVFHWRAIEADGRVRSA